MARRVIYLLKYLPRNFHMTTVCVKSCKTSHEIIFPLQHPSDLTNYGMEIYQFEASVILLVASPHLVFFLFRAKSQAEPQPIDARKTALLTNLEMNALLRTARKQEF